jgi:DNA polymerase-3 subunit gamma/tau
VIEGRLREVAQMEGLEVEDKAFRYIAGAADGSMRDGLSLLDQCNAFNYGGGTLTYERTLEILGAVDTRVFGDLYLSIHDGEAADALKVLDDILLQGRELMQFVTDFTWYLRNLMLLKASEETARSLDISADNLRLMIDQARMSDMEEIMRCIKVFSALPDLIRYSPNRRILTEMTIIRACRSAMDDGAGDGEPMLLDKIKNRIREMETQLYNNEMAIEAMAAGAGTGFTASAAGSAAGAAPGRGTGGGAASSAASTEKAPAVAQELPPALPGEIKEIVANWSKYASEAPRGSRRLALRNARLSLGDHGQLLIIFEKEYGNPYMYQRKDDNGESTARVDNDRRELQQYLQSQVGKAIEIEYRVLDRGGRITDNYVDLLSLVEPGAIRMSVETEDL